MLANLLDADQNGNSFRYFRATDVEEIESELSAAMVGSHLSKIEDESPLDGSLIVSDILTDDAVQHYRPSGRGPHE